MIKNITVFVFLVLTACSAQAQAPSADSVYNMYLDFNLARFQGENQDKITELGENLLPYADKLPEKTRIAFYFAAGKMYEDNHQPAKALPLYEIVAAAVPDYYVVHRALGYLYLDDANTIKKKLDAALTDTAVNRQLTIDYYNAVKKALPHLEKAQACDPSAETLAIIKGLYLSIKDEAGLKALNTRLKKLSKHCIDILNDR